MSGPADPRYYGRHQRVAKRLIRPLFRRLWPITVEGIEHVPAAGPAILCPNHLAAIDSFFVPAVLERPVLYVGKAEYLDDWKTRWLFPALGMIPIDRRGGEHAEAALDVARSVLRSAGLFAIYPEGTRSRDGLLHRGRTGAARLSLETGAPIIPIGLIGTSDVQPVGRTLPRFRVPVTVRFGAPVTPDRYRGQGEPVVDHRAARTLIDEVMYEIQALTGQTYVDRYASSSPGPAPAPAPAPTDPSAPAPGADPASAPAAVTPLASAQEVAATGPARSSAEVLTPRPLPAA